MEKINSSEVISAPLTFLSHGGIGHLWNRLQREHVPLEKVPEVHSAVRAAPGSRGGRTDWDTVHAIKVCFSSPAKSASAT